MFYVLPISVYENHHHNPMGSHFREAHLLHLPDGVNGLLRASFVNETTRDRFEAHAQVICLPHAYSGKSIGDKAAAHFGHWGITKDHTMFDLAEKAAAEHVVFKIRHW
jgi:hypothetical protein